MLVFTTVNKGNLFTDASESSDVLIGQLDGILAMDKFNDKSYSMSIIEKADALSAVFPADTTPHLAMRYISAVLTVKVSAMIEADIEAEAKHAVADNFEAAPAMEAPVAEEVIEDEGEEPTTSKTTTTEYRGNTGNLPMIAPKMQVKEEAKAEPTGEPAQVKWLSFGRQQAPKAEDIVKPKKKTVSNVNRFNTVIDGNYYDPATCSERSCVDFCLNMDAEYSEATCMTQCVATVCTQMKSQNKKWFAARKITFGEEIK